MGLLIENITDETDQRHVLDFEESEIVVGLRFHPTVEMWSMSVEYKSRTVSGVKLSVGVLHLESKNLPFDFVVADLAGVGLDPIRRDDFSTSRCAMYLLQPDEMETVRGAPVPL